MIAGTKKTRPTASTEQGMCGVTETEAASTWSSAYKLQLLTWCFCGTPSSDSVSVSDSFAYSWESPIGLSLSHLNGRGLAFSLVLSCLVVISWSPALF